ncbi:MAG: HAD-IC family P-type ATPase, partial [Pyrinomonadaceae bacterium]
MEVSSLSRSLDEVNTATVISPSELQNYPWHTLSVESVFERLKSSRAGLSSREIANRESLYGPNELQAAHSVSPWEILLGQFKNVLIIILLVATVLSAFLGHGLEAAAITVIVLFAVLLGFVQEYRAERAMEALREMVAPTATVVRDGREIEIPARDLVPGDLVLLTTGDKIAADARLIEVVNLMVEEAPLTGESIPVSKLSSALSDHELA